MKQQNLLFLILIAADALIMVLSGLFFPQWSPYINFLLGIVTFYLSYQVASENIFWFEITPFALILAGSILAIVLLRLACYFYRGAICQPDKLSVQIFTTLAYPFIAVLFSWLFDRLPKVLRARHAKDKE